MRHVLFDPATRSRQGMHLLALAASAVLLFASLVGPPAPRPRRLYVPS